MVSATKQGPTKDHKLRRFEFRIVGLVGFRVICFFYPWTVSVATESY